MDNESKKILVVDDEDVNCKLISAFLNSYKVEVIAAHSGTEAVELCINHPDIGLVLMDISMPDMSGFETARKMLDIRKDIVVIYQTAFARNFLNDELMKYLVCGYIEKPISKETLITEIKKYMYLAKKEETEIPKTDNTFKFKKVYSNLFGEWNSVFKI